MRRNADDLRISVNLLGGGCPEAALAGLEHLRRRLPRGIDVRLLVHTGDPPSDALASAFPAVQILRVPSLRPAAAHNRGLRHAFAIGDDAVLIASVDARPLAGFLPPLIELVKLRPRLAFVSPKIWCAQDPDRLWYAGGAIDWWRGLAAHRGAGAADDGRFDRPGPTDFATGFCMLVRRQAFDRTGPLDESLAEPLQDVDWSLRARRVGMEVHYQPRSRVLHEGPDLGATTAIELGSRLRLIASHGRWYHWATVAPLVAAEATGGALRGWRGLSPGEARDQSLPHQPRRRARSRPRPSASR